MKSLERLFELLQAATPVPWELRETPSKEYPSEVFYDVLHERSKYLLFGQQAYEANAPTIEDAALIVALVNAAPKLCELLNCLDNAYSMGWLDRDTELEKAFDDVLEQLQETLGE